MSKRRRAVDEGPPDVRRVLGALKPFQRRSVEYVFDRLYGPQPTRRFLLADEVGLGKTLVARGVIARAIERIWPDHDRINIVYICSNQDIARQNISRLNVTGRDDVALASRITLLPVVDHGRLRDRRLNFVSFTPGTSFELRSSLGTAGERVLLYHLLADAWEFRGNAPMNVLQGNSAADPFRASVRRFHEEHDIAPEIAQAFARAARQSKQLRHDFESLCDAFHRADAKIDDDAWRRRGEVVGKLRTLLAQTCLKSLRPHLIILDEFQRFKHLLAAENEAGELAQALFDYSDGDEAARVLLLSATPYKMYTMGHELAHDDHYADFLGTLRFLFGDDDTTLRVEHLLREYRRLLYRLADDAGSAELRLVRDELQQRLRKVVCRTERLAATSDRSGMLREVSCAQQLIAADIASSVGVQRLSRAAGQHDAIEYWKAAPYLLSFMEDYALKHAVRDRPADVNLFRYVRDATDADGLTLPMRRVREFKTVDFRNPRLRWLASQTIEAGAWRALWVPPALAYYECAGAVGELTRVGFTKRLIFSNWKVTPKAIATLLSYEVERRMMTSFAPSARNTPAARKAHRALLNFTRSNGRLTGMPVLGLLYPSLFLADGFDPARLICDEPSGTRPSAAAAVALAEQALAAPIAALTAQSPTSGPADESWYWAAPLLLDLTHFRDETLAWWRDADLAARWVHAAAFGEGPDEGDANSGWARHVEEARRMIEGGSPSLGPPPADLTRVLAQLSNGAPGVCALRAISRGAGRRDVQRQPDRRVAAGRIAFAFRSLFNSPDVMSLLRGMSRDEPYWRRVVEYCVDGCLQGVLDEYAHVLGESLGDVADKPDRLSDEMSGAIGIRVANPSVDDVTADSDSQSIRIDSARLRSRFAMRFGDERSDDGSTIVSRADHVRRAFNSPFWPFVLATTSIGQEGLDFHTYCHAIVHWDLPSNPVDLEQREGRIHRYKGHAIRRNVASHFGKKLCRDGEEDPWGKLFELAEEADAGASEGIVPFWVFAGGVGAAIERHVPALPLSREAERLPELRHALAVYRLAFGQPRQDDLVRYLRRSLTPEAIAARASEVGLDLSPRVATTALTK